MSKLSRREFKELLTEWKQNFNEVVVNKFKNKVLFMDFLS